jgi:hypothetical protein
VCHTWQEARVGGMRDGERMRQLALRRRPSPTMRVRNPLEELQWLLGAQKSHPQVGDVLEMVLCLNIQVQLGHSLSTMVPRNNYF